MENRREPDVNSSVPKRFTIHDHLQIPFPGKLIIP